MSGLRSLESAGLPDAYLYLDNTMARRHLTLLDLPGRPRPAAGQLTGR